MVLVDLFALYITSLTALTGSFEVNMSRSPNGTRNVVAEYGQTIDDFIDSRDYDVDYNETFFVTPTDYQPDYHNTSIHYTDKVGLPTSRTAPGTLARNGVYYEIKFANQIVPHLDLTNWGSWDYDTRLFDCYISKTNQSNDISFNFNVYQSPYVNLVVTVNAFIHFKYANADDVFKSVSWTFPLFAYTDTAQDTYTYNNYYYFSQYSEGASSIILYTDFSYRVAYLQGVGYGIEEDLQDTFEEYYNEGFTTGYNNGYGDGYNYGWSLGQSSHNSFRNLFGTLIDTPIIFLRKMFDYELFGISVFKALATVISLIVALSVFRLVRGIF